jgi:hypothetical protein
LFLPLRAPAQARSTLSARCVSFRIPERALRIGCRRGTSDAAPQTGPLTFAVAVGAPVRTLTTLCHARPKNLVRRQSGRSQPPVYGPSNVGGLSPTMSMAEGEQRMPAPAEWGQAVFTLHLAGTNSWHSDRYSHGLAKLTVTNEGDGISRPGVEVAARQSPVSVPTTSTFRRGT